MEVIVPPSGIALYWSYEDVARYLSVSISTIRRKIEKNSKYFDATFPKPRRIGKLVRFFVKDIMLWAERQ